ncbi:MAG: tRNA (adenosine(37)-N6)-threonylcarbamoyltransferase complex ATPase subunit type 1 TsaE [Candidatus Omnitrophica bacterium]|nr:tRNA (adenosine(37)-N6)-threonylcarbamoyltransferase complex ATPase subunit type 1 TsaE [Candidatus Omnitrophota bacterium]MBU4487864.1 tRNA (adenosine(37)-N6)-threonylcarbamoyltransferase complex ATPase subunit type 1 TsaE [Candidatus Omnitrophota bacterium]MCG2704647.1 tRNA (adenosine(37)-N6)-threonylcarbamoyltransferase complex ATPase subunit type 1 TsaE [Candidatus Omnitrophota bacterium]
MARSFVSKTRDETINFGKRLGKSLKAGDVVGLSGQLGSGKTVLTKGIARGLGVKQSSYVNSPSFVILKEYKGRIPLYHFDVYRLKDILQFSTVGYDEYFYGKGVSVVEWADKVKEALPKEYLMINIDIAGSSKRRISAKAHGKRYEKMLEKMKL